MVDAIITVYRKEKLTIDEIKDIMDGIIYDLKTEEYTLKCFEILDNGNTKDFEINYDKVKERNNNAVYSTALQKIKGKVQEYLENGYIG